MTKMPGYLKKRHWLNEHGFTTIEFDSYGGAYIWRAEDFDVNTLQFKPGTRAVGELLWSPWEGWRIVWFNEKEAE